MELAHLSFKKSTYEQYVGVRALERLGRKRWERHVELAVASLVAALHPGDIVLGGGNARRLKKLPPACRLGSNANAFIGGFRMWERSRGNGGRGVPAGFEAPGFSQTRSGVR
jgi:polyphosphate glucokinase